VMFAAVSLAIDPNAPDPNAVNVKCTTTKGDFSLVINPSWAPLGAQRFLEMVDTGFFDKIAAYRVVPGFLVGFGVPFTNTKTWSDIKDDPNVGVQYPVFKRGMLAFAGYAANTRGTEAFISYEDSTNLGRSAWGNPFGIVTSGMDVLDQFYSGYGDLAQFGGHAPDPNKIKTEGGKFLKKEFPLLDYINSCARVASSSGKGKKGAAVVSPTPVPVTASSGGKVRTGKVSGAGKVTQTSQTTSQTTSQITTRSPDVSRFTPSTQIINPVGPLPYCEPQFCGSGIGMSRSPNIPICWCHEACLTVADELPCCQSMAQACPLQWSSGTNSAPRAPAPVSSPLAASATKRKSKQGQ